MRCAFRRAFPGGVGGGGGFSDAPPDARVSFFAFFSLFAFLSYFAFFSDDAMTKRTNAPRTTPRAERE